MEKINILGVDIDNVDMEETIELVESYLAGDKTRVIYTPNTEIVMSAKKDDKLKDLVNAADLVIADGIGLIYGSRMQKRPLKERVTGFDVSMEMLNIANREGYKLYLLGGAEGVAKKAKENIEKDYPNIEVVGYHNGFFQGIHIGVEDSQEEEAIIEEINQLKPDFIFVGLGFPRQEIWINENRDRLPVKLAIGNGGVMDILAGNAERAPEIFQKLGLEWFYRLVQQPSRIKRQMVLPLFLLEMIVNRDAVQ